MKRFLTIAATLALLQGCVSADCDYLAYEGEPPQLAEPIKYPAGVREPTPSGEFRVPDVNSGQAGDCLAQPPMTLPPEALQDPEDAGEDDPEED